MSIWVLEVLKGVLRLFVQPLFYYGIVLALVAGWQRVKRERKHFHIRVYSPFHESKFFWRSGLAAGLILSLVAVAAGVAFPRDAVSLIALVTIAFGLTLQMRLLSPAYTVGTALLIVSFLANNKEVFPALKRFFPELGETNMAALAILLALLLFVEAWLILRNGAIETSPQLAKSKRGFVVGEHWSQRLWFVPVLLPVAGELPPPFSWWPLFPYDGDAYSLMLVPFFIGFSQRVQGTLPKASIHFTGQKVMMLASIVSLFAVGGYWYAPLSIVAAALALIGREWLAFYVHRQDRLKPPHFSKREHGLVILGILPHSKAEKMELQIGEVITKVNGMPVKTETEFYEALQRNRAFCKLEVVDENEEVRFVQGALYEDEHHELGLLFVKEREKWALEAV
ncbi:serine protease, S1-C subfamily, contains C-terminal PDZ domain [Parageobacillus thermantarcticus]|uniref:Serine protease, S1-C subfamily, contains C-terminal PDZ domain n=1 Tax=Parageobacillus thermantarcticus TaxID=186116 RepID=A0A1I0SXF5_9BACL|nr:PDZ domain-containing protein [Parageobacillus thermantarcticus]SFA44204.1 serine protease, S1-C subfamily, contains C-terminal PDZ domain [Parageobacillus thermantarcticus]